MKRSERMGITIPAAASALGISRTLAYQLARSGELPTVRLGVRRLVVPLELLKKRLVLTIGIKSVSEVSNRE